MRIGFDIGGTKLAAIALDDDGRERGRLRRAVPQSYDGLIDTVAEVVDHLTADGAIAPRVGISIPGVIMRDGSISQIVNLPWLAGQPLRSALETRLGRPVVLANDANCFALSEATDGAAAGADVVFGVILGTGVGGGVVVGGKALVGPNANAGEWGHNPWPAPDERAVPCACGRFETGCVETWLNGAALARDYEALGGGAADAAAIGGRAGAGEPRAVEAVAGYARRLAMALAAIINVLDPDVIVLGGGLSEIPALYELVPRFWGDYATLAVPQTKLVQAKFGPDSGLRGAAWL
jgi:fructokinase